MAIDRHSDTWRDNERFMLERRANCVESLINGSPKDERLRGEIRLIDDFLARAKKDPEPDPATVPPGDY